MPPPTRHRSGRRTPRARRLVVALVLAPVLLGLVLVIAAQVLVWQQSRGRLHDDPATVPVREVALVFGAAVEPSGRPSPFLQARLELAAELVSTGRVQVVVVSGDNRSPDYDEPAAMKRWLVARGVPAARVVEDPGGLDTHTSCTRAREVYGVERLLVVSQGYHLPRAVATCRLVGVDAVGLADESARAYANSWDRYQRREWPANVKLVIDLLSGRRPQIGPAESTVKDALAGR